MEDDIKQLVEKNLKLTEEIHAMTAKIRRHMIFQRVVSTVYLLIIFIPIILSIIYLPPLISGVIKQYQDLMGAGGNFANPLANEFLKEINPDGIDLENIDLKKITPELLKSLQKK